MDCLFRTVFDKRQQCFEVAQDSLNKVFHNDSTFHKIYLFLDAMYNFDFDFDFDFEIQFVAPNSYQHIFQLI